MKHRALAWLRRVDEFQQRARWAGFSYGVVKKFGEDQAGNLAALIAYYAFFSIFPLLLALTTILGYVLAGFPGLRDNILNSAISQMPLLNGRIGSVAHPLHGNAWGLVVGIVLAVYSGLAVAKSAQTAFNEVYGVSKADRPGFLAKIKRSALIVTVCGGGLIASTAIDTFATGSYSSGGVGVIMQGVGAFVAIVINTGVLVLAFNWLTTHDVTWRDVLPGAIFGAVAFQILQLSASAILNHKLKGAQSTYGQFAAVIVMLSWFYLLAQVTLLAAEVNVVRQKALWPRAILDEPSTSADYRAYESYADRERTVVSDGVVSDGASGASGSRAGVATRDRRPTR